MKKLHLFLFIIIIFSLIQSFPGPFCANIDTLAPTSLFPAKSDVSSPVGFIGPYIIVSGPVRHDSKLRLTVFNLREQQLESIDLPIYASAHLSNAVMLHIRPLINKLSSNMDGTQFQAINSLIQSAIHDYEESETKILLLEDPPVPIFSLGGSDNIGVTLCLSKHSLVWLHELLEAVCLERSELLDALWSTFSDQTQRWVDEKIKEKMNGIIDHNRHHHLFTEEVIQELYNHIYIHYTICGFTREYLPTENTVTHNAIADLITELVEEEPLDITADLTTNNFLFTPRDMEGLPLPEELQIPYLVSETDLDDEITDPLTRLDSAEVTLPGLHNEPFINEAINKLFDTGVPLQNIRNFISPDHTLTDYNDINKTILEITGEHPAQLERPILLRAICRLQPPQGLPHPIPDTIARIIVDIVLRYYATDQLRALDSLLAAAPEALWILEQNHMTFEDIQRRIIDAEDKGEFYDWCSYMLVDALLQEDIILPRTKSTVPNGSTATASSLDTGDRILISLTSDLLTDEKYQLIIERVTNGFLITSVNGCISSYTTTTIAHKDEFLSCSSAPDGLIFIEPKQLIDVTVLSAQSTLDRGINESSASEPEEITTPAPADIPQEAEVLTGIIDTGDDLDLPTMPGAEKLRVELDPAFAQELKQQPVAGEIEVKASSIPAMPDNAVVIDIPGDEATALIRPLDLSL